MYLPFSTPTNDYYGGHRHGDNLFAESLVCLDAATGKRVWHYQVVHHGVWDYDLPAAPNLVDVTVDGRRVKAVAQVTKQGFVFVFDRVTGDPLWPIEDRPVPQSKVPGEKTAADPAVPDEAGARRPPGRAAGGPDRLHAGAAPAGAGDPRALRLGPALHAARASAGRSSMPGVGGGASWSGAAFDPETGRLYVTSRTLPFVVKLNPPDLPLPTRRSLRRRSPAAVRPRALAALQASVRTDRRDRPQHRRARVDGAARRRSTEASRCWPRSTCRASARSGAASRSSRARCSSPPRRAG